VLGNRVLRKKVVILAIALLLGLTAVLVVNPRTTRIAYHKWRLIAAIDNTRTAGAGKPTPGQEFLAMLRGGPPSSEQCLAVWQRHEDALVKLKYLVRREFPISKRVSTEERVRIAEEAEKTFPGQRLWSIARSLSNEYAVVVTALPRDMAQWERLIYRLEEEAQFARKLSYVRPRQLL
jgi:hypothetical protein